MNDEIVTFSIDVDDPLRASLICDLLWINGIQGVEEIDAVDGTVTLRSSFGTSEYDTVERLTDLFGEWTPPLQWEISRVDPTIIDRWKQFADVIDITSTLRIVPSWLQASADRTQGTDIVIDPGPTFGLGDHPTTRGSLLLISRILRTGQTVLDVGCGSGILGISALVLGASRAQGIDINPASIEVSRANAIRNGVDDRWTVALDGLDSITGRFDLLTANILAPVLIDLADDLKRLLDQGGTLVISGVLHGRFDHVLNALEPLTIAESIEIEGWASLALRR
jgi:ribosomal protein L11 methyltransferase